MNSIYGFDGEVQHKYNNTLLEIFRETFRWLPLAHVLNDKYVCSGVLCDDVLCDDVL